MSVTILDNAFISGLSSSSGSIEISETLPPECYTHHGFYEFEKEALFNHEWLCVGRENWVGKPGDFFTTSIIGEPIVVARDLNGNLHAMSSVCQHRAMLVAEGSGNSRGFVCPYHHWTYGLDGRLVNAPAMGKTCDFQKEYLGLPTFRHEIWQGFVFINFDKDAPPLTPRLATVAAAIENFGMAEADEVQPRQTGKFPWNWKVMFENNNDGYHANKLHRGPLHDFVPSHLAEFPEADWRDAGFLRYNGTLHPDASFNATQRALLPIFPNLNDADRNRMTFANIPPTLSLVMMSDMVIYLILRPDGPESLEQDTGVLVAPGATKDLSFQHKLDMNLSAAGHIIAQDMHVDEHVQIGLRSRFAVRGRYSWQEGAQQAFNNWLVPRYQATWARLSSAS